MLERYGVENIFVHRDVLSQIIKTNQSKYDADFHFLHGKDGVLQLLNNRDWLAEQYDQKSAVQLSGELGVSDVTIGNYLRKHNIQSNHSRQTSYMCIQWLQYIMVQHNNYIQHAGNGGEYAIPKTRYKADGYCADTNTVYEFHGDVYHGNPVLFQPHEHCHPYNKTITAAELYHATREREDAIRALGYNLVVIWEKEWYDAQTSKKKGTK